MAENTSTTPASSYHTLRWLGPLAILWGASWGLATFVMVQLYAWDLGQFGPYTCLVAAILVAALLANLLLSTAWFRRTMARPRSDGNLAFYFATGLVLLPAPAGLITIAAKCLSALLGVLFLHTSLRAASLVLVEQALAPVELLIFRAQVVLPWLLGSILITLAERLLHVRQSPEPVTKASAGRVRLGGLSRRSLTVLSCVLLFALLCAYEYANHPFGAAIFAKPPPAGAQLLSTFDAVNVARRRVEWWRKGAKLEEVAIDSSAATTGPRPSLITLRYIRDIDEPAILAAECLISVDAYTGRIVSFAPLYSLYEPARAHGPSLGDLGLDYQEALQLAEEAGGQALRAQHPGVRIEMELRFEWWSVEYYLPGHSDAALSVVIDMVTGEITQVHTWPTAR